MFLHGVQNEPGVWKYVGGDTFLESVPVSWKYADLVFSLAEKVDGAISLKYQLPGEDLDPDGLISVADDSDIAVRFIFPPLIEICRIFKINLCKSTFLCCNFS